MKKQTALHLENGVEVPRIGVMAAFGCKYQGDIAPTQVISTLEDGLAIAEGPALFGVDESSRARVTCEAA